MLKELMERVSGQYEKNLPFVVYRKPKEQIVSAIFQADPALHLLKDFKQTGFVFSPFDSTRPTVLIPLDEIATETYIPEQNPKEDNTQVKGDGNQKEFHIGLVQKGIEGIREGKFQKVVLSRKVEVTNKTDAVALFQNLLAKYGTAFCYLWHHPEIGTWLGATPEILLKTENRQLTTMSLAGTQRYDGNANPEWGKKEREEQQLVTEYVTQALEDKVSSLKISKRESIRAGSLLHLRTKLTGIIENNDLANIVAALHPTPAVCGMPMEATKKFILENENYNREYYTGYLGELNFRNEKERPSRRKNQEHKAYKTIKSITTFFVNLRCMKLTNDKACIYVGGGVTKDSDPEREWQETVAKSTTILQVLKN